MTEQESGSAPLEIHEITFDALNPYAAAQFWSELLGRRIRSGDSDAGESVLVEPTPGQPGLLFMRVPQGKTTKNRVHLDLWPTHTVRDAQIARALNLGAVLIADMRRSDGSGWAVLRDREGNEFCIGSSAAERQARRAR